MTDKVKISELDALSEVAQDDQIIVLDVSDTTDGPDGTTKRANKSEVKGLNWQGAWSAGSYNTDDAVEHNGSAWVATADTSEEPSSGASDWDLLASKGDTGATGATGATGPQGDEGMNWQGAWSAGTYNLDDVVSHNGSAWICTAATTTEEPSGSATDWDLVAARGNDGDMARSTYDPTNVNGDAFDMDNMVEGSDTKILTAAERAKIAFIAVTQNVDLDQMETDIAALANGMVYKGNWDASAGSFPGAGAAQTGWFYTVSVGGTVDGVVFNVGDRLIAIADNASATTYAANWTQLDATDAVTSVAGLNGNISASALRSALNVGEIIDEDDMASDSATKSPSQQSVKAYVDNSAGGGIGFGDGSDGDATLSSNTTLTEDKYYNNLTIDSGVVLNTAGYRIFVLNTLTNNGTIRNNGSDGTSATQGAQNSASPIGIGGAGAPAGTLGGGADGGDGGVGGVMPPGSGDKFPGGTGGTGANQSPSFGTNGRNGGGGGSSHKGDAGAAGVGGTATAEASGPDIEIFKATTPLSSASVNDMYGIFLIKGGTSGDTLSAGGGGPGGGGGGGVDANATGPGVWGTGGSGGGGGGGGGVILIAANTFINAGTIEANGGNGGDGADALDSTGGSGGTGGGGGGAGGNGGIIFLVYSSLTDTGTIQALGGTGGTGGAAGGIGGAGGTPTDADDGKIFKVNVKAII